jgi:hypothetical protein
MISDSAPNITFNALSMSSRELCTIGPSFAISAICSRSWSDKDFALLRRSCICFGGLIFAGIRMMSGRFQDAIPGLFGALFGAGVLGWGAGWIGSLTGQNM